MINIENIKKSIILLKRLIEEEFSQDNASLFEEEKKKLMENAPIALKNELSQLQYANYDEDGFYHPYFETKEYDPPSVSDDVKTLLRFYEEELFNLIPPQSNEDLYKKKLLQAKNINPDFYETLGIMIVGDMVYFPRRSSFYITKFFQDAGYPQLKHDGSTRRIWVANQLKNMSIDELYSIIKCLFRKRYFQENEEGTDLEKAKQSFKEFLSTSCQTDDFEDIADIFDVNVNSSLLFNQKITTKDTVLNEDLENARQCYLKGDFQLAVEKIWDVFERIKSLYNIDKKKSVSCIINTLSDEIKQAESSVDCEEKELLFNQELKILTDIGNTYKIRHSEQKQKPLSNNQTKEYLFFRVLNIINLIYFRMHLGQKD